MSIGANSDLITATMMSLDALTPMGFTSLQMQVNENKNAVGQNSDAISTSMMGIDANSLLISTNADGVSTNTQDITNGAALTA